MSDAASTFRAEASEHLAVIEEALLELEERPQDSELVDKAFRSMHTIKGAGGMVGFNDLSAFTHYVEFALDDLRKGKFGISQDFISLMLDIKDHIQDLLGDTNQTPAQAERGNALLERLAAIAGVGDSSDEGAESEGLDEQGIPGPQSSEVYRIRLTPAATAFVDGFDALPILRELAEMGEFHCLCMTERLPLLAELDGETCYVGFDVLLATASTQDSIADAFIFVADDWEVAIEPLSALLADQSLLSRLAAFANDTHRDFADDEVAVGDHVAPLFERWGLVTSAAGNEDPAAASIASAESEPVEEPAAKEKSDTTAVDTIRVPSSRLDELMNLVGELVIVQARLSQIADTERSDELTGVAEDLERLTVELRDNSFSLRTLPIGTTFGRFRRLVRDLSRNLEKDILLETEGGDTELDKLVIDRLADPLVHLIRNSADHGLESPEERAQAGKPREGRISLTAQHAGSHVVIDVVDDGAGLNTEKILGKAIERGLVMAGQELSHHEICQLIFEPGFSTAAVVSDVSGRGVGMDVVRRTIEELGGFVTVESESGTGTKFHIALPMTLAIIEGLLVSVGQEKCVLPLSDVEECLERATSEAKRFIDVRGELVPVVELRDYFEVSTAEQAIEQVVITRVGNERCGFTVDHVIGQHQTVIKRLGRFYEGVDGVAGATILGDGNVAMILDTGRLIEASKQNENHTNHNGAIQ